MRLTIKHLFSRILTPKEKISREGEFRRAIVFLLVFVIFLSLYTTFLACRYSIEIELGDSLNPLIGRGAILIVQYEPPEVRPNDIVTVITVGDEGIIQIRKVLYDIEVSTYASEDESFKTEEKIHLVSPTRDYGWFPVSSIRAKVVCVLFRGFVHPPEEPIIYPSVLGIKSLDFAPSLSPREFPQSDTLRGRNLDSGKSIPD